MSILYPTLELDNLTVAYRQGSRWLEAVRDISLQIDAGQTYGLVGESGSGKTTIAMAIMRYLGEAGSVRRGRILFEGRDLVPLNDAEMRTLWGSQIGLVPQNPLSSLNPSMRIGKQVSEILVRHGGLSPAEAQARTVQLLRMVRLPNPEGVAQRYPHQISGGMQQRVLIAMALSTSPRLLVLDEPTTSLDVTTQASVLDLFRDLIDGLQSAVLYVTHNLGVVSQICDRVAVLYAGELVEDAPIHDLFHLPLHPYTQGLFDSIPKLGQNKRQNDLRPIQGQIPPLGRRPAGCVFIDRCPLAIDICRERPPLYAPNAERRTRCHRWMEIGAGQVRPVQPVYDLRTLLETENDDSLPSAVTPDGREPATATVPIPEDEDRNGHARNGGAKEPYVLDVDRVQVYFKPRRSLGEILTGERPPVVKAVNGVSLSVPKGQTVGLVGESGSGKTTLARAVAGLVPRNDGQMELLGSALPPSLSQRDLDTLRHLQMVFQNPEEALNPYMSVGASLRRPLMNLMQITRETADAAVEKLLAAVRLPAEYARRMPSQLSGGEKQRIAIARAFATQPALLLADEPVSSLDVSVQASIMNLMNDLQAEYGASLLFISHDLAVVGYLADTIAVIYLGYLMEVAPAQELFSPPYHPYTEALLSAVPVPDPHQRQEHIRLEGDVPSPTAVPSGCPFHTRCPRFLGNICVEETPPWREAGNGVRYFCHIPPEELTALQRNVLHSRS